MAESLDYDCVVVGAGVEGSATAFWLAERGQNTLLLEQFPLGHSRGSSHGHSRITRYAYNEPHFARMMPECFKMWSFLESQSKTKLYRKEGLLVIDEPPYESLVKIKAALQSIGHQYTELTAAQICSRYRGMRLPSDAQGIVEHEGGLLLADKCLRALQTQFQQRGGTIQDSEQVLSIIPGETVTIVTNRGRRYTAKSVVLTPGPWASKMLRPLGLDPPLKPWRLDVCYWKEKQPDLFKNLPVIIAFNKDCHTYALPSDEYPGLVKLCDHNVHEECDPDRRDAPSADHQRQAEGLRQFVRRYFPGLEDTPAITETCMYTFTPDENFYIDTHPKHRNIVIGCGFSGHGFKLAPVMGKLLSELAMQSKTSYDLTPFRLDRFPNNSKAKL